MITQPTSIGFQDRPQLFEQNTSPVKDLPGTLTPVTGGFVIVLPNSNVFSLQPDGSYGERPPGTAGSYEVCQQDPAINILRFNPSGIPYAIAYHG